MKVLHVCCKIPFPPIDGGCKAMLNLAELLASNGNEMKLLAMETHKHPVPKDGFPHDFKLKYQPDTAHINTRQSFVSALKNLLFEKNSYLLSRFSHSNFEHKLLACIKKFSPEVIIFDSLYTCGYVNIVRKMSRAKLIYRAHNIEFQIWENASKSSASIIKKMYLSIQYKRLKQEELRVLQNCDGILAITPEDAALMKGHTAKKLMVLPYTIDVNNPKLRAPHELSVYFIGAMDWFPNLEALNWIIKEVWPVINQKFADAKLYIAGKAMPDEMNNYQHIQVINLGEVANMDVVTNTASIMLAPVFSGGGLKIKTIEAMAAGKAVIGTQLAFSGIPVVANKNCLIASDKESFIAQITKCFKDYNFTNEIGLNASLCIQQNFSISHKAAELQEFILHL